MSNYVPIYVPPASGGGGSGYTPGGTDVAVADGGTGASTAGGALTNLGLSAFIQTVVDDASASTARTTLGVTDPGMVLISDSVRASAGTFDFTSIPGTYKHLKLILAVRLNAAVTDDAFSLRLNNDSGSNYTWQYMFMSSAAGPSGGGAAGGTSLRAGEAPGESATAGHVSAYEILIPDYAATVFNKGVSSIGSRLGGNRFVGQFGGNWLSTAAVTRVTIIDTFAIGSRATLYGVA